MKPVKVYIMLGQSNMLGFGRIGPRDQRGTLEHLVHEESRYQHHADDAAGWKTNEQVRFVQVMHKNGKAAVLRNERLSIKGRHIGPELEFGRVVGSDDHPTLLLKSCIGNRSLGWDLLPPGSESFEQDGRVYAGYKQSPDSWEKGTTPEPIAWYAGKQYDDDISSAKEILKDIGTYYPGATSYHVAGFCWWQGHKDGCNPAHANRYQHNLGNLIRQLRTDFNAPSAKFVLATVAFNGSKLDGHMLTVLNAQMALEHETEFAGTVKCVDARPYWRDASDSPSKQGHHYNHNAETYLEVGRELGVAMMELESES